jgi:hypothetical protein
MEPRIQRLGCSKWQDIIRNELGPHAISIIKTGEPSAGFNWETKEALLYKYEKMEQVSLFELAVWKASCIMETSEEPMTDYAMLEYKLHGWKKNKGKMLHCSAIDVIIRNTLTFLS